MIVTQQNLQPPQENEHEALAAVVHESLRPVSLGLCLLYLIFATAHSVLLPRPIAIPMVLVASGSAICFAVLLFLLERSAIPIRIAHQVAAGIAQIVLFNSLLHLYLSRDIQQSTNILLLIVGVACFCLSTRGVVTVWLTAIVGWILIVWALPPSPALLHFSFAMFAATVLAVLVYRVRLHTHQRLEHLRLQEVQQRTDLEVALAATKEVDRLKDDLISTVSHELRTPLTSLLGFTELMLNQDFPQSKQRELLTIVHNESLRLTRLINNFLDLQAIGAGYTRYHFTDSPLAPLLEEAMAVFSHVDGKHSWQLTIPDSLPLVHIDTERIRQVLANLLSNAVKFSTDGGTISVGARVQDQELTVWVADQGVGISAEVLPKLFAKFFRVDDATTSGIGGTGLGLALVKEIVEAHQGRVWVESVSGKGSTFYFTLPLRDRELR